ncbi:hypothetical protein BRADI_2g26813v3 [Brachypodium distachyon]|uniref:Uncharacterized protein n=1 Tax=Brachypodium distachyon TaxID=15368 RepID=A0A0Q3J1H7_BRADI|nr:hypothetical protein BRADI_2g26813v3 [Brachypodium distachyon]
MGRHGDGGDGSFLDGEEERSRGSQRRLSISSLYLSVSQHVRPSFSLLPLSISESSSCQHLLLRPSPVLDDGHIGGKWVRVCPI